MIVNLSLEGVYHALNSAMLEEVWLKIGQYYERNQQARLAEQYYSKGVEAFPESFDFQVGLAQSLLLSVEDLPRRRRGAELLCDAGMKWEIKLPEVMNIFEQKDPSLSLLPAQQRSALRLIHKVQQIAAGIQGVVSDRTCVIKWVINTKLYYLQTHLANPFNRVTNTSLYNKLSDNLYRPFPIAISCIRSAFRFQI